MGAEQSSAQRDEKEVQEDGSVSASAGELSAPHEGVSVLGSKVGVATRRSMHCSHTNKQTNKRTSRVSLKNGRSAHRRTLDVRHQFASARCGTPSLGRERRAPDAVVFLLSNTSTRLQPCTSGTAGIAGRVASDTFAGCQSYMVSVEMFSSW